MPIGSFQDLFLYNMFVEDTKRSMSPEMRPRVSGFPRGPVLRKYRNFGVLQFPLCPQNGEILSQRSSQPFSLLLW